MSEPKIVKLGKPRLEEISESVEDALYTEGTSYHGNIASVLWDALDGIKDAIDRHTESQAKIAGALNNIADALRERG
jgi:hypothetical protein